MLLALLVSGCQGEEAESPSPVASGIESATPTPSSPSPDPKPSPSPTPSPSSEEELLTAEAIAALEEYVALSATILNNGGQDWEQLLDWWGTQELIDTMQPAYEGVLAYGLRTEGAPQTVGVVVQSVDLNADGSTGERVRLELCLDMNGVTQLDADGQPVPRTGLAIYPTDFELYRLEGRWLVAREVARPDTACTTQPT